MSLFSFCLFSLLSCLRQSSRTEAPFNIVLTFLMSNKKHSNSKVKIYPATRIEKDKRQVIDETVAQEALLRIFLNEKEMITLSCTPFDRNYLAAGFLVSEGFLKDKEEIEDLEETEDSVTVHTRPSYKIQNATQLKGILTSGCGKGKTFTNWDAINPMEDILINLDLTLSFDDILKVIYQFEKRSELFRQTAGVHSAALAQNGDIFLFNEDIGRHNAVDKVLGESFLKGVDWKDKFLVISGRISSDIVSKLRHCGINLVVSRTAPTSLAVNVAQKLGITLVGFARGNRMNVYSYPVRIK
jgi:FdhD protein